VSSAHTFTLLASRGHQARAAPGSCSSWSISGDGEGPQADPRGDAAAGGELPAGLGPGGPVPLGMALASCQR